MQRSSLSVAGSAGDGGKNVETHQGIGESCAVGSSCLSPLSPSPPGRGEEITSLSLFLSPAAVRSILPRGAMPVVPRRCWGMFQRHV